MADEPGFAGKLCILESVAQLNQQFALESALSVEETWLSNIL
jgi:hypothetical protein